MDELMMNLFSLIASQVRNKQELFDEEGKIMESLLNGGYHLHEADAALTLMQTLVQKQAETFFRENRASHPLSMRTMNSEERRRFTPDAFAFVLKLTHLGLFSQDQREEVLERAMSISRETIDLANVKTLVAFMLFTSSYERDDALFSDLRHIKNTAWN